MRKSLKSLMGVALALSLAVGVVPAFAGSAESTAARAKRVHVTAMDFHLMGAPKELKPKRTIFTLKNEGSVKHEMVIVKMLNGKTFKQLLNMPPKKANKHIKFIGRLVAKAGEKSDKKIDTKLRRGRYVMVCFFDGGTDKPHVFEGMFHKFKVRR